MYLFIVTLFMLLQSTKILAEKEDISNSPFCKDLCQCDLTLNDVNCNKEIAHLNVFNDSKFWIDETTNKSFPYRRVSIQNSGISVVTQIPESPVQVLDLSNNRIQIIEEGSFKNLQNMVELSLSNNQLESKVMHPNTLQGKYLPGQYQPLRALKVLRLDGNEIHTLHQDFFEHTDKIETLDLHGNPFNMIDLNILIALGTLQHLKNLDLSYCGLTTLPVTILHTLKHLEVLNLTANDLTSVPETFKDAHNLIYLNLNNNSFVNVTEKTGFPKMPRLQILHFCNMHKLTHIQAHSMCGLVNLTELHISDNPRLVHLDVQALSQKGENVDNSVWPPVKKIYLRNNKLSYLDQSFLSHWDTIEDIDIRDNPWACECETQWIVDNLIKVVAKINVNKTRGVDCAAPIEMAEMSIYDLSKRNSSLRCLDLYGNRPEKDATIVIGILTGILIGIPVVLLILYLYKRKFFGFFESGPAAYSRKFYNRASAEEGDF